MCIRDREREERTIKMKKKLLVAAILAAMTMFAAACGSDDTKGNSSTDNAGQSSEAEATPAGQDSGCLLYTSFIRLRESTSNHFVRDSGSK